MNAPGPRKDRPGPRSLGRKVRRRLRRTLWAPLHDRFERTVGARIPARARRRSLSRTAERSGLGPAAVAALYEIDRVVPQDGLERMAVVATVDDTSVEAWVAALRHARPQLELVLVTSPGDQPASKPTKKSSLQAVLAASGPYDVIVDMVTGRKNPAAFVRFVRTHVRSGGLLVLTAVDPSLPAPEGVMPLLDDLLLARREPPVAAAGTVAEHDRRRLADAVVRSVAGPGWVVITLTGHSLAKIREWEIDEVLKITGRRLGRRWRRIRGEVFESRCTARDHASETVPRERASFRVPALSLREYRNVLCAPGQIVATDTLLLPETFRHVLQVRPINRMLTDSSARAATIARQDLRDARRVDGTLFHFDSEWPGHYGHVLSEQVSRLWGLAEARRRYPDLRVLIGRRGTEPRAMPFERAILECVGSPEADIELVDEPIIAERLIAATPMFSMPKYVSPQVKATWDLLGDRLALRATATPRPRRFFCTRAKNTRVCANTAEVEAVFAEHGFTVLYPERLSFPDQVALFREADVVAGFAGSALFTLMFCSTPKRVLVVSPESYRANNEYLIAAVQGHEIDTFWSVSDGVVRTAGFTFDHEREGRRLRSVLAGLDDVD